MRAQLLFAFLATPAAFGQVFADGASQLPTSPGANASVTENVDWADVDLDGDFDALFADGGDWGNDQNRLWINQGGAQGGATGFFLDETSAHFPALQDTSRDVDFADLDGDGDADLLVTNTSAFTNQANQIVINQGGLQNGTAGYFVNETATRWVSLGVNNGTTSFSSIPPFQVLASGGFIDFSGDAVLGDLDEDGDQDILHSSHGDWNGPNVGKVPHRIFLNDGLGFFEEFNPSGFQLSGVTIEDGDPALWASGVQQQGTTQTNGEAADIATMAAAVELGDLDGDFDLDLILGELVGQPRAFRSELSGGVLAPFVDVTGGAFAQAVTSSGVYDQELGDLDGDGDLDLYGVNWAELAEDAVMLNDGDLGFGPFLAVAGTAADGEQADLFDYDADGDLDVYLANPASADLLYANQGPPGHALAVVANAFPPNAVDEEEIGVDSADVDLDGDLDVMTTSSAFQPNVLLLNRTETADTHAPRVVVEQVSSPACDMGPVVVRASVFDNASWEWTRYAATELELSVDGGPFTAAPMTYSGGQIWRGEVPAGTVGTIAYRVRSTDVQGNAGLSATLTFSRPSAASYCTAGVSASGCSATLSSSGAPSLSAGSGFTVLASNVEGGKDGLYFYGFNGAQANPWGNGTSYQCVVPPVIRTPLLSGTGSAGRCDGNLALDLNAFWASAPSSKLPAPGQQVDLQLWYRDPLSTSNQTTSLSDALEFCAAP